MRVLAWTLSVPVALILVVFAVANRHDVRLELWPLPWQLDVPVYLAVLGALGIGVLVGTLATWAAGWGVRKRARVQRRRAESLERQLHAAQAAGAQPVTALIDDHAA